MFFPTTFRPVLGIAKDNGPAWNTKRTSVTSNRPSGSDRVIGKCSKCGGEVVQAMVQHIVGPPMPAQCRSCGATEDTTAHLPTIPMR